MSSGCYVARPQDFAHGGLAKNGRLRKIAWERLRLLPDPIVSQGNRAMKTLERVDAAHLQELSPGDRIEVEHLVTVGTRQWTTKTAGKVLRTERRRQGLHCDRNFDDKAFSDVILLEMPDGELATLTIDEFTTIRRA